MTTLPTAGGAPLIVRGMPEAQYHAIDRLGGSSLNRLRQSPAHFRAGSSISDETALRGTAIHCGLLEPAELGHRFVAKPPGHDGRTREGKAWLAENADRDVVSADVFAAARNIGALARQHATFGPLLDGAEFEVSAFWRDPVSGVDCKARFDAVKVTPRGVLILDAKSTQDARKAAFFSSARRLGYALQSSHYMAGARECWPHLPILAYVLGAFEAAAPYGMRAYTFGDDTLARADALRSELLELYAQCRASGDWPAYDAEVDELEIEYL